MTPWHAACRKRVIWRGQHACLYRSTAAPWSSTGTSHLQRAEVEARWLMAGAPGGSGGAGCVSALAVLLQGPCPFALLALTRNR